MNLYPLLQNVHAARSLGEYDCYADDEEIKNRRRIVALSMIASGAMATISLYQFGQLKKVPGLPLGRYFDAEMASGSPEAYQFVKTPDAFLGLIRCATTAALAAVGGEGRARRTPWIPIAPAAKATIDTAVAAKLTIDQPTKYGAFCELCLAATAATFATLPLICREASMAIRRLRSCRRIQSRGGGR